MLASLSGEGSRVAREGRKGVCGSYGARFTKMAGGIPVQTKLTIMMVVTLTFCAR